MRVADIIKMGFDEISRLSDTALRKIVDALGGASQKRLNRFIRKGLNPPSIRGFKPGFKFRRGGKTREDLLAAFAQNKAFLESKTSTIKGYEQYQKAVRESAAKKLSDLGIEISEDVIKRLWKSYDRLVDENPEYKHNREIFYEIRSQIATVSTSDNLRDFMRGQSDADLYNWIKGKADYVYKKQQEEMARARADFSKAFDFGDGI